MRNAQSLLSAEERKYIRRELDMVFTTLPTVAEGILLKVWASSAKRGQPKLPPQAQSLVDKALARVDSSGHPPRLVFTPEGVEALRKMMSDPRLADPAQFAHIRRELGIDLDLVKAKVG